LFTTKRSLTLGLLFTCATSCLLKLPLTFGANSSGMPSLLPEHSDTASSFTSHGWLTLLLTCTEITHTTFFHTLPRTRLYPGVRLEKDGITGTTSILLIMLPLSLEFLPNSIPANWSLICSLPWAWFGAESVELQHGKWDVPAAIETLPKVSHSPNLHQDLGRSSWTRRLSKFSLFSFVPIHIIEFFYTQLQCFWAGRTNFGVVVGY
jgi:hypothetical protein